MKTQRQIIFHEHYFVDFYVSQTVVVQEKIEYVFKIIRNVDNVPKKFLDHMTGTDGIFEIRMTHNSYNSRLVKINRMLTLESCSFEYIYYSSLSQMHKVYVIRLCIPFHHYYI